MHVSQTSRSRTSSPATASPNVSRTWPPRSSTGGEPAAPATAPKGLQLLPSGAQLAAQILQRPCRLAGYGAGLASKCLGCLFDTEITEEAQCYHGTLTGA